MSKYIIIKKQESDEVFTPEEHGEGILERVKSSVELHNRDFPDDEWSIIESDVWPLVEIGLDEYKSQVSAFVSARSYSERSAILNDQTISNILIGATEGYPAYLTKENTANVIEQFKSISRQAKADIAAAKSKSEIDEIVKNLKFPTAEDVLHQMGI